MTLQQLQRVAESRGIQTSYIDATGKKVTATRQTLEALVEILGPLERGPCEPVIVQWNGKPRRITVRCPAQLRLETGETLPIKDLVLPRLPFGYHTLQAGDCETLVISAPTKTYNDPALRHCWGVFAPTYALHDKSNPHAGSFAEWNNMIEWLEPPGAKVVGTLPLLASFMGSPVCEPSPYSPASRLFWNEFCVSVEQRLRILAGELVNYAEVAKARRAVLEPEAVAFFRAGASAAFERYRATKAHLDDYAAFRAANEKLGHGWHTWPKRMRNGEAAQGDYDEHAKQYYMYAQWRAQEQMDGLLRACRNKGMEFYLDLPLGVHPDGYDVWRERDSFALEVNAGAPPDPFFTKGQNWGFAPLNPQRMRANHYRYLIEFLRFQMRHTGLLRIDHVMWLHRLYWIPKGGPAREGAYVRYQADELYAILSLESHRNKTVLVGENLGTVPPEVNDAMKRHGLHETYVLQYELGPKIRKPPRRAIASLNTHDMPAFEAFLRGLDIDDRFDLGLIKRSDLPRQHRHRRELVAAIREFPGADKDLLLAALRWLARSDAAIVLVNIEDLWRETLPQNVPGTSSERPNWRRKLRYSVEQIRTNDQVRHLLKFVADARAQSPPTDSAGRGRRKRANAPGLR